MNGLVEKKLTTKLVSVKESQAGELIIKMRRGNEENEYAWAGYRADIYDAELEFRQSEFGWTQDQFDKYWDNGGEEKEIKREINATVEIYNDEMMWEELKNMEWSRENLLC
ncbi:hypothetical protein DKZ34_04225 [Limosilactobacillus reuteri]|uniref:hypothetical protein n=1 Tax=Limosilactobacillus reuteri TaxID=1598 RepID=UPI000D6F0379|nr:hypothetical protein [Limosilactobacillus reuteri]PWT41051.1 hypothetical protein DKZ34_04225 [Limosilactobacillus reuteri]